MLERMVKHMLKSMLYQVFSVLITLFSLNVFAAPNKIYHCASVVISIYDQLVVKSLPLFSPQYKETMALFRSLGINNILEDIKVIYLIYLRDLQPNPMSLIDLYIKKNKQFMIGIEVMGSSMFANVMTMHDGSTFNQFFFQVRTSRFNPQSRAFEIIAGSSQSAVSKQSGTH